MVEPQAPFGRRTLIWVVGVATAAEAVLEALAAIARESYSEMSIWGAGAVAIFLFAGHVERVKAFTIR